MGHSAKCLLLSIATGLFVTAMGGRAEAIIKVTRVMWLGDQAWKIEGSANGIFYFEAGATGGTGFSSAIDQEGKDWILNDASTGSGMVREYRGFPNLGDDNFNHPQRNSGSTTRWVGQTGTALGTTFEGESLVMESSNAMFAVEYHFFASHVAIKMVRAGGPYSFLYEGPIGGVHQPGVDWIVGDSDLMPGMQRPVMNSPLGPGRPVNNDINTTAFPGRNYGKFFYMGDPVARQVLFIAKTPDTAETDEGYGQASNMTIASFGRGLVGTAGRRQLTGTTNVCTFGFLTKELGHSALKTFIEGTLASPFQAAGGGMGAGGASGGTGGVGQMGSGGAGGAASASGGRGGGSATGGSSGIGGGSAIGGGSGTAGAIGSGGDTANGGSPGTGTGGVTGSGGATVAGTGGSSSASGGATSTGSGGSNAGTGGPAGTGGQAGPGPTGDSGGCSAAHQPHPSSAGALAAFGVALLAFATLRRRRPR